jgi:hypothetical protein
MFNFFKRKRNDIITTPSTKKNDYDFKWYDPGGDNPFPFRILDCRPLTHTVISTTKDRKIAETFNSLRKSNGRELTNQEITDSSIWNCDLRLPHNGSALEGIVFQADCMEVKWDIYIYDSIFLFSRSWSGNLIYRANAEVGKNEIKIRCVHAQSSDSMAVQNVYFLMASHAMNQVFPHSISSETPDNAMTIACESFALFGNRACYATYEDITKLPIVTPNVK